MRVRVLADCAVNSLAVGPFPMVAHVRPTEMPNVETTLAIASDQTPLLHFCLLHRSCDAEEFYALSRNWGLRWSNEGGGSELFCGGSTFKVAQELTAQL
jgi:hypothetical protein